jgi:hypothetical protein
MESVCTAGTAPCFRECCNGGKMCNFNYYVPINGQLVMRFFSLHDSPSHYPPFFPFPLSERLYMRVLIAFGYFFPPRQVKYQHADAFSSFSALFINGVSIFYFLSWGNIIKKNFQIVCLFFVCFSKRGENLSSPDGPKQLTRII